MVTTRQKAICIILCVITFAVLVGTIIATGFSTQYEISVNEVCPEDIFATRTIVDTITTASRREASMAQVEDVYTLDSGRTDAAVSKIRETFRLIFAERNKPVIETDSIIPTLTVRENTTEILSDLSFHMAITLSDSDYETLSRLTPELVEKVMSQGVTDKTEALKSFENALGEQSVSDKVYRIACEMASHVISENKFFDLEATEAEKEKVSSSIPEYTILKNQVIVRKGEIVTEAHYAMLSELGFVKGTSSIDIFHTVSIISLLLIVFVFVIIYYILIGHYHITASHIASTVICSLLLVMSAFMLFFTASKGGNLIYLMPLSMVPALIALLLNGNLACMVNMITAILAAVLANDVSVAVSLIIAGSFTGCFFSKVRRRAHLLPATLLSALSYALCYSSVFIDTSKSIVNIFTVFSYALLGGFFGGILTIGTLPFWEAIFDVITPMKLGELSNPEHKLLKKLLLNAPGTYHHSLTVANMADSAAQCIKANALLARVGAYYHDIGKINNPPYFKENQFGIENPHDHMDYRDSAEIIIKHVSDGVALSEQHRLPKAVRDIIIQHHGTTTASYFLYKAREENPDIDPSLFTYPGPTPQTKEATIIMLADACEAAVRAMREKGDVDVRAVVDNIVSSRISEGQLSDSSLTFSDLEKVKASFVKTLDQYFHKRIIYPQNEIKKG